METKEEAEKKLNALRDLYLKYVGGNLSKDERAEIKEAEEYIHDIADGLDISLDENISDEQIRAIYDEYLERVSGSKTLGTGADLARGIENTAPYVTVVLIVAIGVENPNALARLIMHHHVIIAILGVGGKIAMDIVKKWSK